LKKFYTVLFICFFVLFNCSSQAFSKTSKKSSKKQLFTAPSAILVDVTRNKIIFSRQIHKKYPPASTIKILSALIALEELGYNSEVGISRKASLAEPSKVWLPEGAIFNSFDLISAVLISSANDASVALAEAVSGNEQAFAKKMNKKAKSFGTKNSNFTNASGLPSKSQYSTAYDLYRITKFALQRKDICNIMRKKREEIKGTKGNEINLVNHNKLLFKKSYPTVLLKTGYTKSAGHCYCGKIYYNGREYVFAFLKSRKPWKDIDYLISLIKKQ